MGVPTKVPTVAGSRMRNQQQLVEKNEGLAGFEPATCGLGKQAPFLKRLHSFELPPVVLGVDHEKCVFVTKKNPETYNATE